MVSETENLLAQQAVALVQGGNGDVSSVHVLLVATLAFMWPSAR
jgi:hypothetical protein